MRINPAPPRRRPLSLTALIDVVFILLVFFMLVTRLVSWGQLEVSLAAADGGASAQAAPTVALRIQPEAVLLDGRRLHLARAVEQLSQRAMNEPELRVFLAPAPEVPLQRLVIVLERLKTAGLDRVRLLDRTAPATGELD